MAAAQKTMNGEPGLPNRVTQLHNVIHIFHFYFELFAPFRGYLFFIGNPFR
jgi:hypothetical protein